MAIDPSAVWDFAKEVIGAARPDRGRTLATVTRIDADGTTWVTTGDGGEAPAGGAAAGVSVGDTVTLEWDGSAMGIRGNVSNPSPAGSVVRHAVARAQGVAEAAQRVADAVNQHFFSDTSGIHVTEATQEDWDANHSGANVLINSVGQLFRDGLNNLLTLTTESGARALTVWDGLGNTASHIRAVIGEVITLGSIGSVRMILSSGGLEIDNEAGTTIFAVESNSTGTTTVTVAAEVVTWAAETDVTTTANTVSDASAAAGDVMVTATVADTDYTLDSTYATATVTVGTGVSVALTSDGVDYVQSLMSDAEVTTGTLSVEYQRTVADSAQLAFNGDQIVTGVGRAMRLHNDQWSSNSQTETFYVAKNESTGTSVMLGVGSGGYNRGVFDATTGTWLIYRNQNGQTVISGSNFSVADTGSVGAGPTVVAKGINRVALYSSTTSGDMGLRDMTNSRWIIYRHHNYGIVLGNSAADHLYARESTVTVNTSNVAIDSSGNYVWNNGAVCSFLVLCHVKSALADGSELAVGIIPANYRPPHGMAVDVYTSTTARVAAKVDTVGNVTIKNVSGASLATSTTLRISGTWAL